MFKQEGNPEVVIIDAFIAVSPYDKSEQDIAVALKVQDKSDQSQSDFWYGVLNNEYGIGNHAGVPRWKITLGDLEKVGWDHGRNINDETLKSLIGKETTAWVAGRQYTDKNGQEKTVYDVKGVGGGSFGPKKLEKADADAKLRALFGGEPAATGADGGAEVTPDVVDSVPDTAKPANPFD